MTYPDRNNPYSFDEFTEERDSFDFYRDDPFFQRLVERYTGDSFQDLHQKLLEFSPRVSFRWRDLADSIARPEARPYMEHFDGHNHRVDRIIRPMETRVLEQEIFGEGLFSSRVSPWEQFTKRFLLHQLGEFGVMCPVACTEGLIALIEYFSDHDFPELDEILLHCKEGIDGDFGIGAQFMSEIQGGSDLNANLLEAEPAGRYFKIHGTKFFCSAAHADYTVVTAKVTGSEKVGTFIVPSYLPGGREKEQRNSYVINRLKWKTGTVELPTAEIFYDGAVAYPVGPLDKGVVNAVGIVLTLSRLAVGVSSGAAMLRAAREALMYAHFRDVFGHKIARFPLAAAQLEEIVEAAQRTCAGAFKVYDLFLRLGRRLKPGLNPGEEPEKAKQHFNLRELILMQKITTADEAVDVIRKAVSLFGGHGVMEDFSSLPRLLRDALVNELWEGPRNVLLTQIHRDLQRASQWYPPNEFVFSVLEGAPKDKKEELAGELTELLGRPLATIPDREAIQAATRWEAFCDDFFKTYQTVALEEVGRANIL